MKKSYIFPLLFLCSLSFAQDKTKQMKSLYQKNLEMLEEKSPSAAAAITQQKPADKQASDVIIINSGDRANDYKQAFDLIRKEKSANNIIFTLKTGTALSNILDMTVMDKGTLILFKINTAKGVNIIVTNIEDIQSLTHK